MHLEIIQKMRPYYYYGSFRRYIKKKTHKAKIIIK